MTISPTEIRNNCRETFKNHEATLVQDSERFTIIDWQNKNGSTTHYINYIVDKKRGSLIVSGDTGESIATWYSPKTASDIKAFVRDEGYYASKFQTASHHFVFEAKDMVAVIKEHAILEIVEEFWESLENDFDDSIYNSDDGYNFKLDSDLIDTIKEVCIDADTYDIYCWLNECRKLSTQVYLWAEGFRMACDQLGL